MQAVDSYKYDALCRAVRGLVNSGILVFVAAGNEGKDTAGQKSMARFIRLASNLRLLPSAPPILFRPTAGSDDGSRDLQLTWSDAQLLGRCR